MNDDQWRKSVDTRLQLIETRNAVDEVHRHNVVGRLSSIEDTLKWLVRLVLGALLMAVVAYALQGGLTLG